MDTTTSPPCPQCGQPAVGGAVRDDGPHVRAGSYRCAAGHIWETRWFAQEVARLAT